MKKWVTDKSGKLIQIDDGKPESSAKKSSSSAGTSKTSSSQKSTSGASSTAKSVGKSLYTPKPNNYGSGYIYSAGGPQNLSDEDKRYYSIAAGNDIQNRQGTAAGLMNTFNGMQYQRDAGQQIKQGSYIQKATGVVNNNEAWANTLALYPSAWVEDVMRELGIIADNEIATSKLAEMGFRARSGDASVLNEYDASIANLKNEGLDNRWYNKLFGTNRYSNQDVIDEAEDQRSGMVDLLQLSGMETIRNRKPQTSMIDYTEDDYYADLNTILHKAQGIDIPQEDYLEAAKRVRGFVGNTAVEQAAFADPSGQWMDQYRGLYGQRMNTLDKYIDKHSGTAGTEYDFSAEDYTSYQRSYDRYVEREAEQEQKLNDYNATRAEDHQKLANNPGYAVDSRYVQGGDYWRLEDDGYTETVDYGSMMNDLVHASAVPGEIDKVIRLLEEVPNGYGARASAWADTIRYMSDADRKDFTYLYNTQGIEAAEQFLDSIRWGLNKQRNEAYEEQRAKDVRQSGWSAAGYSVGSVGEMFLAGLEGVAMAGRKLFGMDTNEYDYTNGSLANVTRGVTGQMIADATGGAPKLFGQNIFQMGYNAVMSAADSAVNTLAFGTGGAVAMGFNAFGQAYQQGLEADKSDTDAFIDALVDGAIETGTEYFSVEAFLSDPSSPMGYFLKNMFTEGAEEGTGTILRMGYDQLKNGIDSAINTRIDELRRMGYSPTEAKRAALKEWLNELAGDMATGALSGGVMSGPGAVQSYAENRSTGKALQENAGDTGYQGLIDLAGTVELSGSGQKIYEALTRETAQDELTGVKNQQAQQNAEDMRMAQVAEELDTEDTRTELTEEKNQQAQQRGKAKVSRAKLGQLYREVMQKLDEKAQDVLREFMSFDLAKELRQLGLPAQEAKDLAGSVLRIQDGSFTEADVQAVSGSTEALDVLSAWTALAGAVDKAKGAVSKLAGMLQKNGSASEVTENGESITADGEEPVSMEAAQPEDEFDVQAAEVQAQAENLLASEGEASTLDGEEIEVLGVAPAGGAESDGAPMVRIRTADGAERSVAAKDIAYGTKDAGVYQLAAYAGKYGRNADKMYNLRLSGQDVNDYARAFSKAAQTGSDGRNLSLLVNSGAVDVLTPGQAQAAYDIGRAARVQRSQAQQEALGAKGVNVQVGRLDVSQIERVSLNKQQRASVDAMGKLAKALGINVRFVESKADESGRYTTENGSYDPNTRTLTLDIHAGSNFIKDTRYAVMNTAGHELTHYIRQFADSALWDGYQDFVMDHLDGKMNLEKEIQKRMAQDSKLDRDGAIEEIVADASGEALSKITEAQLQEMAQENPTLLQKIANFMKKWIGNLKRQIELAFKGTEAKTEVARQMRDALDEMAEMWNGLLVEASRTANQTAQKASPAAAQTTAQTTQTKATQEAEKLFIPYAHIDQRDIFSVKEEHTELFCGEVEEARFAYAAAAEVLLDDLNVSVPGQKIYIRDSQGALSVTGQNRTTSDLLARMKDETDWTWDEIRQTLTAFADMGDAEKGYPLVKNTIRNRRMEVYLHEMLTRGYKTLDGTQLAPWREYVEAMAEYQGSKGAGMNAQAPKGAIPFEEYAFADMFADDGDVKFSRRDFASQIDDLTNGTFPRNDHLYVMETPQILLDAGLDKLPILMTQKHARSVMKVSGGEDVNYHGLTKAGMKQLPQAIADSALVIKAPGYSNRVIAFTSMENSAGEVIIAPIEVAGRGVQNGKYITANVLTTAYGKAQIKKMIVDAIMNDEVLSLDKEKSRQLAVNVGVQFPKIMRKGDPIRSIREFDQNVKRSLRAPVEFADDSDVKFSMRVTDKETLRFLNGQETVTTYKTMQVVDGKLYPPMAAVVAGAYEDASVLGAWEQATERPDLIKFDKKGRPQFVLNKGKGKGSLAAAYNPYMHSSNLVLNDQFSSAYDRPNLVTVECEVPASELTSGYHAQYAKDSVGWHPWHTGTVAGALRKATGIERQVLLSRWIKPVRIVPNAEVAAMYKELLGGTGVAVPDNVVPPALLAELKKAGVAIAESGKVQPEADVKYSGRYDYDTLVAKPDMHITMLDNVDGIDRREAYRLGRENVMQYADRLYRNETPMMYVSDLGKYVVVGKKALGHGLDRRANKQKSVITHIGDILNNSIVINEADPKKAGVKNSWILLGVAMDSEDRLIYVRSVVNQSTLEVDDVSALYAVYGKTNEAGRVVTAYGRTNGSGVPSNLTISIADLLKGVKGLFDDVISEDVANRLGIERSESEFTERLRYQQRDPDQISDRELLATALQNVTQNADEWDNLRRYQKKIAALNEKQRMLEQTNARIAELKGKSDRASKDELIRMQNNARTLARSIDRADGELLKYEAMKPIKKLAERQREDYRQKLKERTDERMRKYKERLKQDMQDRIREVREREAERGKQRLDKAVEHAREAGQRRMDRLKESEAKAKYRERIQKDVSTLREWLTQPTNKGHVPQFLRAPLADFLESLDFTSARALRGGDATRADQLMLDRMDALRRALANTREQQAAGMDSETAFRDYLDLPQGFVSEFDAAIADIKITLNQGGTDIPVNRMTAEQLKTLSNMIRTINTAVRKANSFLANRRYQTVSSAAQDTIYALTDLGTKPSRNTILEKAGGFLDWTNATPYYVFKRFGEGGKAVFEGLMDGWDRLAFNSRQLIDYANGCYTTEQVRAWSQELHEFKLDSVSVQMTTAQIMSLYCLNKRAQARGHLLGGGIRIADIKTKRKTITQADNHILGAQDIANITKLLTAEQRSVADKLQEFMNTVCTDWGNEVSMQRFGYKAFGDEANYFPIETDSNNRKAVDEQAQENSLFRLLNLSATKSTIKNANNALVVRDIFDVFSAHCTDMAKYNALALPILDALKWYNYVEKTNFEDGSLVTESVQKALEKAYGKDAQKYIKNFLRDLNGVREGGRNDGLFNKMLSNYKIAAVAANLRVGLLQITSMPRAAYAIDPKYLAIGVARNAAFQNSRRAEANVGICLWKSLGFYDTNISRNVREMVKHDQSVGSKVKEKSMILAEKGDAWTMGVLYGAVEAEMADKHPGVSKGSKAYSEMVNARVREIVYQTQVVDSTMTRSDIMRDTGAKSSLATAFMSEPTLTMNMLADSVFEQRMKARESGKKLIAPSKKMVRAFAVNAVVLAFSSVMEAAFTAWRDDDEYETYAEKFDDSFLDTLLDNMNPANNLPFVKDVVSAIQGRSTERMDSAWAYNLAQGVTEVYKYLTGQSKNPAYNGIYKTLNGLSQMSGFAVGGLTREVVSLYNNLIAAPMGYTRIQTYADSAKDAADAILRAYAAGDNGLVERYIGIAAKHGIEGDKLENAIKSTAGEAYKAGNIDELMLQDVLVQYAGKTEGEAYWAIQEMGYAGDANFSKYTRLKGALESGDSREANDAYTELIEHGVAEDNVVKQLSALYNSGEATSLLNLQMRSDRLYSSTLKLKADKQAHKDDFDGLITAIVNGSGIAAEISSLKAKGYTIKQCMSAINGAFGKSADVYRTLEKYNSRDAGVLLNQILDAYEALGLNRQEEIEWIDANWPKLD